MCFSFPEFRSQDEEKSHLLDTSPEASRPYLQILGPGRPPLRTGLELELEGQWMGVKIVEVVISRLMTGVRYQRAQFYATDYMRATGDQFLSYLLNSTRLQPVFPDRPKPPS